MAKKASQDDSLESDLQPFLLANPEASMGEGTQGQALIETPWSDDTLELVVNAEDAQLIEALNMVRLPPRFSALWHKDTSDMEFIWTVARPKNRFLGRQFEFRFAGASYNCEFADSSARLLALAKSARPAGPMSSTIHRNLMTFSLGIRNEERRPTSFWIRNLDLDDTVVELAQHLNFFTSYFDPMSPMIVIHPVDVKPWPTTHPPEDFPEIIIGRQLDPNMLQLWAAAKTTEPFLRFLYLFQILEYAAFYHLDQEAAANIKRLLQSPDALWRIDDLARRVLDVVADYRSEDAAKLTAVIKLCTEPEQVWPIFEQDENFFCQRLSFEGGFSLDPLLREGWTLEDFRTGGFPRLADSYRKLRNALAHGRRAADVIQPTVGNARLLEPWIEALRITASNLILFEGSDSGQN